MHFESINDFLAMGGYGLYVWGSLGMCGAAMLAELMLLRVRRHALTREHGEDAAGGKADEAGEHAA
ncbi:MAG: heme exporter protein CcmD [Pseudomonadota bacterium]